MSGIQRDEKALADFIRSPRFQDEALEPLMQRVEERAREISPVVTGLYKASWRHEVDATGGHLFNDAPYSLYVELGTTTGSPAQHIAVRALDAIKTKKR